MSFSSCSERTSSEVGFRGFSFALFLVLIVEGSVARISVLPGAEDIDDEAVAPCDAGSPVSVSFLGAPFLAASFLGTSFFGVSLESLYRGTEVVSDLCHCAACRDVICRGDTHDGYLFE